MSFNFHIGSNSYISRYIYKKNDFKINRKKFNKKQNLILLKKKISNYRLSYIFIYIGKNFKNKKRIKSEEINYKLPLKIINILTNNQKRKIRIILFGSYLENYKKISRENSLYIQHKKKLKKKIFRIYKENSFDFVWLKLPIVYSDKLKKDSFIYNLKKFIRKKKIIINHKYQTVYFIHTDDINKQIKYIIKNWKTFRNKEVNLKSEGPYYLHELIDMMKSKKRKLITVYKNIEKLNKVFIKTNIKIKIKKLFNHFKL